MVFQIEFDFFNQLVFMRTIGVQPEHSRHTRIAGTGDGQLHPIANRRIFDLAHAPNVAFFHVLRQQHFACGDVYDAGLACFADFKGFVV